MNERREPARLVPPGRIIRRELEARGWRQKDLAQIMGRPEQAISEIVNSKKRITAETARELASAFGTSIDFWINLENHYCETDDAFRQQSETPLLIDVFAKLLSQVRQLAQREHWKAPPPWWRQIDAALIRYQTEKREAEER